MSTDAFGSLERDPTTDRTDLEKRTRRALEQYLTVLDDVDEAAGADDLYVVVSESGSQYCVDARGGSCTCPDAEHRDPDGGCKHVRRVAFATGADAIPAAADPDAVDDQLGAHVDGPVRWACEHGRGFCAESAAARDDAVRCSDCEIEAAATPTERVVPDGGIVEAGDEGELLDEDDDVVDLSEVTGEADPDRPDDCDCGAWNGGLGLPCWPCYREGFETPASAGEEEEA
ncbi:hypothetical protein [Haloplanus halophilus]|uniref:hypothetical protein n=1 Tax=Haloplanus halophilus TaxID=2949993 RepID=UPI00203B4587|nr:hypothetical protein [Haloplanus sp. GDY1]